MQEGRWAYTFGMMSIIGAGIVMLVAVSGVLQFVFLKPIAKLTENVLSIDESTKKIKGFETGRRDEIGTLSREFDAMVQRLSKSEERYRLLAENAHDIIFTMDTNLRFTYISPSIMRIRGFTVEEAMSQTPAEALTPTSLEVAMKAFLEELEIEARETKDPWRTRVIELEETCKDGSTIWTETTFSPLRDDNNKFIGFLGITRDMSERKHAEKALRESQQMLRLVLDTIPVKVFWKDRDSNYLGCNRHFAVDAGLGSTEEVIGKNDFTMPWAEQAELLRSYDREVIETGLPKLNYVEFETRSDGSTVWLRTSKMPILDAEGRINGVLGTYEDITQSKNADEALRESQRRMSDIIDFLPDATFAIDRDGKVIAWNRAIEEMTGVPKQEILGKDHYDYAVPFYGEARPVLVDLLFEEQENIKKKYDFVTRDGEKLVTEVFANRMYGGKGAYLWAIAAPLYDSSGQMVGAIECIRDITERKKAEELILLHSATIEQSLDGIVMVDLNNTIHYVNPAWAAMHGYAGEGLKGKHISIFYTEDQMQKEVAPFFGQALEHGSMRGKLGHVKRDGTIFPTLVSVFLLKNDKGIPVALIVIARDITEELRMENQLYQAQKMEVVGQLAGGVAHDLNNMLSPVLGYTEIILMEMQPEDKLYEDLMQIKISAERARNMTHQLLAFSRKQLLEMKVVDLAEVVASYGKMLRRTIREDIAIQMQGDVSRGAVRVDTDQIGQVLMNLAINAQDAMPQGGTISIETTDVILDAHYAEVHQGAVPGPYIMLSFSDTGMGMESRTIERIFEPFFTTKEQGKGTGLGLATVYGIVKQHGGYIMVYSEPGMGTIFKIYLPRVDKSPETLSECSPVRKGKSGTETLVVAEDDAGVRELVSNILEKHGYSVITAETNEMLIQVLNDHDGVIHMLLTDVIMPDMNGKELFEKLKPIYPEMKVIYMSGYTGNIIAHHGILEDGVHFIQKPFTMSMLTDKIRNVLDERTT
jgi:PAS domain S-box-containing protein